VFRLQGLQSSKRLVVLLILGLLRELHVALQCGQAGLEGLDGTGQVGLDLSGPHQIIALLDEGGADLAKGGVQRVHLFVQLLGLRPHLQQLLDGIDEALVVQIAYPLDLLVMTANPLLQLVANLLGVVS